MGKDRRYEWANPTIDQAINAGQMIALYYGKMGEIKLDEEISPENLTDADAQERILDLVDAIVDGSVKSHAEVAKTIRSLGHKIGPMGSVSTEIDVAAYHLARAIFQKQSTFQELQS